MRLAVIPARGGSKRIPRKNIRPFGGKPMIAWSIEAAMACGCFDRVIVSTDDEEIASTARNYGAEVPFMRPAALSDDHTGTIPVVAHAIQWHLDHGLTPSAVCCIYATAPFIRPQDLQDAWQRFKAHDCDYVLSVTSYAFPIQRAVRITPNGRIAMFQPENFNVRSQDLEPAFHDAGQFYWGRTDAWLQGRPIFAERSQPQVLPRERVQDIDTPEDWQRAQWLFRAMREEEKNG